MNIDDMEAGPDLDILIATKVMKWRRMSWKDYHAQEGAAGRWRNDPPDDRDELTYGWHDASGRMLHVHAELVDDYYNPDYPWSPSTNIAEAFELVERFADFYLSRIDSTCSWHCALDFSRRVEADCRWRGVADTAPLAICIAALKAVSKTARIGWKEGR